MMIGKKRDRNLSKRMGKGARIKPCGERTALGLQEQNNISLKPGSA